MLGGLDCGELDDGGELCEEGLGMLGELGLGIDCGVGMLGELDEGIDGLEGDEGRLGGVGSCGI